MDDGINSVAKKVNTLFFSKVRSLNKLDLFKFPQRRFASSELREFRTEEAY